MTSAKKARFERMRSDPSSVYTSPLELALDETLPVEDRLDMLRRWAFDARKQLVASSEGMAGGKPGTDLREIAKVMETLTPRVSPTAPVAAATPAQHGAHPGAPAPVAPLGLSGAPERAQVPLRQIPFGNDSPTARTVVGAPWLWLATSGGLGLALGVAALVGRAPLMGVAGGALLAVAGLLAVRRVRRP